MSGRFPDHALTAASAASSPRSDGEDEEAWALELEEELLTEPIHANGAMQSTRQEHQGTNASVLKAETLASTSVASHGFGAAVNGQGDARIPPSEPPPPPSLANELPQEVLRHIVGFTQVGRISKAWSLAASTLARTKFSTRLTDILRPFTASEAEPLALDVELALFAAYGQPYSLPKSYGQKARQLLFNLKDSQNAALRERLVSRELDAPTLVCMSASDMANPQLVRQREQWIKKRTHEVMRDTRALHEGVTQSDMFECRSCGSFRTGYRQWRRKAIVDRTRVIVMCMDCPYRWEL